MENPNLNQLVNQVNKLTPTEQHFIIETIIKSNKSPLKDSEKMFLEKSKEYITELQNVNSLLKGVIAS